MSILSTSANSSFLSPSISSYFPIDISKLSFEQLKNLLRGEETIAKIRKVGICYGFYLNYFFKGVNFKKPSKICQRVFNQLNKFSQKGLVYSKSIPISFFFRTYSSNFNIYGYMEREIIRRYQLVKTINDTNKDIVFFIKPKIYLDSFVDQRLLVPLRAYFQGKKELDLTQKEGLCVGICDWFLYLYFSSKKFLEDEEAHLICLSKEFDKGGSFEAAILQTFPFLKIDEDLRANIGPCNIVCECSINRGRKLWRVDSYLNLPSLSQFIKSQPREIENLQPILEEFPNDGIYAVNVDIEYQNSLKEHRILVKKGKKTSFVFDPNNGLIKIKTNNLSSILATIVNHINAGDKSEPKTIVYEFFLLIPRN